MAINVKKQIEYWLKTAEKDFETAGLILDSGNNLHHCLFFCHLVIEKHLKALVVKRKREIPPKTHDLEFLANKVDLDLPVNELDFLTEMNQFVLEARYPDEKLKLYRLATRTFTKSCLDKTECYRKGLAEIAR